MIQQSFIGVPISRKPSMGDKLREMANKLDNLIEKKRNTHRGKNLTHKRQKEIDWANKVADALEQEQTLMRTIADIWDRGTPPPHLASLKHRTHFTDLVSDVHCFNNGYGFQGSLVTVTWASKVLNGIDYGDRDKQRQIERLVADARLSKIPGYFPTPDDVSDLMLRHIRLEEGDTVLEPEAGDGQLAEAISARFPGVKISCIEWSYSLQEILELRGYPVLGNDFLEYHGGPYTAVIMNPPFEKGQDIDHIMHAYDMVADDGWLLSVASEGCFFNKNKKVKQFREWLDEVGAEVYDLPSGAFAESGTGVKTRYIVIKK